MKRDGYIIEEIIERANLEARLILSCMEQKEKNLKRANGFLHTENLSLMM